MIKKFISIAILLVPLTTSGQTRFSVSDNGHEIIDSKTGLIWRRCPEGMTLAGLVCSGTPLALSHEAALRRAVDQATLSGRNWRLPNIKELSSIVDRSKANPAIDTAAFPTTPANNFWSSSPEVGYPSRARNVYFYNGNVSTDNRSLASHVRLVRN